MMAWLPELNRAMRSLGHTEGLPAAQIDALSLNAITVSDICSKFAPHAPMPLLEKQPLDPGDLGPDLEFGWLSQRQQRALSLVASAGGGVVLLLLDTSTEPGRAVHSENFTYDQLRSAIVAFFDGWPRG